MSIDSGYPRAVTIPVPQDISEQEIGDYVSNEALAFLVEFGTKSLHRRSVYLRFIEPRLALLQFEATTPIQLTPEQREKYKASKAAFISSPSDLAERKSREAKEVSSSAFNRSKQTKVA